VVQKYKYENKFQLESGQCLDGIEIAYEIKGNPSAKKVVWVCHALSGNSDVFDWWAGLFGEDKLFNPSEFQIICANVIGSCYGSTGPETLDSPADFPLVTIRDIVNAHVLLRKQLGIESIDILIGASLGGQQALEWSIIEPNRIQNLILVATNAVHSPYGRAFNEAQRLALKSDPTFGKKNGGKEGLKAARAIAMLSYRSYEDFEIKQSDLDSRLENFRASSYVTYQGEKFLQRFKSSSYNSLSKAMDSHDVFRGRKSYEDVLGAIKANTLVVGVNSDVLFPISEQEYLADNIRFAEFGVIDSVHGHDAFLIEYQQLENLISDFLYNDFRGYKPTVFKQLAQ
jgi:homoserine O-acetyltransferase